MDWSSASCAKWHTGPEKEYIRSKISVPDDLQSKSIIKEIVFRIDFYSRNDRHEYWKHIACILRNNSVQKKGIYRSNLQCPLANEDDL